MQSLMLIKPTLIHKNEILNYKQTYENSGLTLHGANQLAHFSADTFEDWLAYLNAPSGTNRFGYDKVSDSTYLAWHTTENRMVGIIHLRHTLNDYLLQYEEILAIQCILKNGEKVMQLKCSHLH
ncbi:GNAT family N-acetyltransferase [Pasteurella sp. PK-2025]|uniref:GNAT family N-acetyltransferase n=1 Tax=Pasteurella sp. PK-2025 TaxID=3413133 RepID=UPI003C79566B